MATLRRMDHPGPSDPPGHGPRWVQALIRTVARLAVIGALAFALHLAAELAVSQIAELRTIGGASAMIGVTALVLAGYALLIAIPFVPGIEVGIALLILDGATVAPFVYAATVIGLMTSYLIGRHLPLRWVAATLRDLRLHRAAAMIAGIETLPAEERIASLRARLPPRIAGLAVKYRYVALAVLVNLPGTVAVGGGGGILMLAGISRLFFGWATLATLMLATLPVPLAVWVMGTEILR
jgi:hypothetical protein